MTFPSETEAYVPAAYHRDEVGRLRALLRMVGETLQRLTPITDAAAIEALHMIERELLNE